MRFWCSNLYINKFVLSCWSFNYKCISHILLLYFPLPKIVGFDVFVCGQFPTLTVYLPLLVSFFINNLLVFICSLFFSIQRTFFNTCCKVDLMILNSHCFCFSVKLLISPSNLNENLAGQNILVCGSLFFITLNILCHSLLVYRASAEKSSDNLMGIPLNPLCGFSLAAFNTF